MLLSHYFLLVIYTSGTGELQTLTCVCATPLPLVVVLTLWWLELPETHWLRPQVRQSLYINLMHFLIQVIFTCFICFLGGFVGSQKQGSFISGPCDISWKDTSNTHNLGSWRNLVWNQNIAFKRIPRRIVMSHAFKLFFTSLLSAKQRMDFEHTCTYGVSTTIILKIPSCLLFDNAMF